MRLVAALTAAVGAALLFSPQQAKACSVDPTVRPTQEQRDYALFVLEQRARFEDLRVQAAESGMSVAVSVPEGVTDFTVPSQCGAPFAPHVLASFTKQVTAVLTLQAVERGLVELDTPASTYLPQLTENHPYVTVRQLLQHRSALRNPDDTEPDEVGVPAFYRLPPQMPDDALLDAIYVGNSIAQTNYCLEGRSDAYEGRWRYNNCDYLVLGALLEVVSGKRYATLVGDLMESARASSIAMAGVRGRWLYANEKMRTGDPINLMTYGASGALIGTLSDVARFDRALLDGRLLTEDSLETLWDADPDLGYMALGQWVYEVTLMGCEAPVRIVERRGHVFNHQMRNFIFPDDGRALVVATTQADAEFGELWQQAGASYDLASTFLCGTEEAA